MATKYNLVAQNSESTVVAEYSPSKKRVESYQSEADLESAFIKQLQTQAYEYVKIVSEEDLVKNLRKQLEKLNDYTFSDKEWDYFFKKELANPTKRLI
jgi:type I restriction enzyme R subunit